MKPEQQWQEIKANYLKLIEKSLAQVDHPQRSEILSNVREHLDSKYAELDPEQHNWESYQQIITEMGPPEEYAELLSEENSFASKNIFGINQYLAIIFIVVLAAVGGYLVHNAKKNPSQTIFGRGQEFELDEQVLGRWTTVDFVKDIDDFNAGTKSWQGEMSLKEVVFEDEGNVKCTLNDGDSFLHKWTKGKVDAQEKRAALYHVRDINGQPYLFFEWLSGDVMVRGRKPYFYVLKKVPEIETAIVPVEQTENKSIPEGQIDGTPVAFIVSFKSASPLKTGTARELLELFNEHHPQGLRTHHYRTKVQGSHLIGYICTDSQTDAEAVREMLKQNNMLDFLGVRSATQTEFEQYCLQKQVSLPVVKQDVPVQLNLNLPVERPIISKPSVIGKWLAVDCIKNIQDFNPELRTYQRNLLLKDLDFTSNQIVYWNFQNNTVKKTSYSDGVLKTVNDQQAKYFQKNIDGQDFLFVEWITPEVINEGEKPDYYVLKRQQESFDINRQDLTANSSPVGKWMTVDFVQSMEDFIPDQKQWRGDLYLKDLTISENGTTSGPWTLQQGYLWHPGNRTKSQITIRQMQGATYLFMEWMSGDVTIRGQKPRYYVLKKLNTPRSNNTSLTKNFSFGENYCTSSFARSLLGSRSRVDRNGRMLRYNNLGLDLLFSQNGPLSEVHFNKGYTGQLDTGISLSSSKMDVFNTYGRPGSVVQTDQLSGRNDERVLYENGNTSRIYYGRHGLIFWFQDNKINQIVMFKGRFSIN